MKNLNTGWKKWDLYLNKFTKYNEPLHVLEIGAYEGDATLWFLKNLLTDPKSTYTAIDTWEGSPEYVNVNFKKVEDVFDENIKKSGMSNKVTKIKDLSYTGLVKLLAQDVRPEYHVIFIDASHEARDVLADAVLSWPMLKKEGVMIFDDYKWEKLSPEYFRPRPAIDSFIKCMAPELEVLGMHYQAFVSKKSEFEKPVRNLGGKKIYRRKRSKSKTKK
jgi:predicted O-methyltransferase YrrM